MPFNRYREKKLTLGAPMFMSMLTPTALSAGANDYSPTNGANYPIWRIDGGAGDRTITGIAGGVDGRVLTIVNVGTTNAIVLANASSSSAEANRILGPNAADITIRNTGGAVTLVYDGTSDRWRALGGLI